MPRCLLALLLLALAACASRPPAAAIEEAAPPNRPGDGLLADSALQAVVQHQLARDGAALIAALRDTEAVVRARAAFALGSVQDPTAVPALLDALDDADARVRADAAFALGQTADSTAEARLLDAFGEEPNAVVQRELLDALGKTGSAFSLRQLASMEIEASLRAAHALAMARYGLRSVFEPTATALLARLLEDEDPLVRHNAAYFFGRVRDPGPWLFLTDDLVEHTQRLAQSSAPEPALMHLALALGKTGADSSLPPLRKLLTDRPDWRVRANAARALALLLPDEGNTDQRPPAYLAIAGDLFAALDDASPHVRLVAAQGLASKPSLTLADDVVVWIRTHPDDWQTAAALLPILVGTQQNEMIDYSQAWLHEQTSPFALAAGLAALRAADDPASLGLLFFRAQDDDSRVAYAALDALKTRWGRDQTTMPARAPRYYAAFEQALERRDLATAYAAAPALADTAFASLGAAQLLQRVYIQMAAPDDIEPMVEIVRALGSFRRDSTVIGFLMDAAIDGHPVVRRAAADALETRIEALQEVNLIGEALPPTPGIDWDVLARLGRHPTLSFQVATETGASRGDIVMRLDAEQAPQTTQTLARLCAAGTYDGVPFHRVVPNFVIQGGDSSRRDGFGGPGFTIRSEFTRTRYTTGTIGIASAGKDTEGNQYFVTHSPQPHLDGRYTAVGRVIEGQAVADAVVQGDVVLKCEVRRAK